MSAGVQLLVFLGETALDTVIDVLPIAGILVFFQVVVLRRKPPHLARIIAGFVYVLAGLTLFLVGGSVPAW